MKNNDNTYRVGVDVGSTTLKIIILDHEDNIVYKAYRRHKANINQVFTVELEAMASKFAGGTFHISLTGSAGMGISERTGISFVQEVVAAIRVINQRYPDTHTLIDLGGEDAKMVFFREGRHPDIRMNGSCAGGTGSFIDQMADLMNISADELSLKARQYEKTYPVASRCGVFAKTDVQNLISRNIPVPDIAKSILHTVALQSITSLARGVEIKPRVLCIGGPLTFIPGLRESFRDLLELSDQDIIVPDNSEYFSAWGTALEIPSDAASQDLEALKSRLAIVSHEKEDTLDALFGDANEYGCWKKNRKIKPLPIRQLGEDKQLECFLGIDSGSTTTKVVVMDSEGNLVYKFYDRNEGNPLKKTLEGVEGFYTEARQKGVDFRFIGSAATGYGEDLIKSALNLDHGIVETMAHLSGAQYVDPEVSFVLDIGGQDMKSIFIQDGIISNIELNEACSSGCGSFLQNFAATMNMTPDEFTAAACESRYPCDLGSRCTVFMNSKVKQSLRANASFGDISAGLAYSVVKNCLFKVLKISNLNQLGDNIVVQGGTFRNHAVYRALEMLSGKSVSSTDHPELMGALGAALYARKMWLTNRLNTSFTGRETLPDSGSIDTRELQCKGCTNKCSVLRFKFTNGNTCYAGNKCEKIFYNAANAAEKGYNAFETKNEILFGSQNHETEPQELKRQVVGIPRVLNMFENYPFWETFFSECGFDIELSPESTFPLYQRGVGSVMSDNICFPAKVVHGHIMALADKGVDRIFYPIVPKEEKEMDCSTNSYNCPVVSGYPDVVRSSMDPQEKYGIPFDKPVITFNTYKALEKSCKTYFTSLGVPANTFKKAFAAALQAREKKREELTEIQRRKFEKVVADGEMAFVVAGRPYHADPLINQKVGQILSDLGIHVFTDDIFRLCQSDGFRDLKIVSQWSYPNRVVQAAMQIAKMPQNVQLIQLNSFGCGPDSFFMDEIKEILTHGGKNHTVIRIDEIASPGSVRLRLRSLVESLKAAGELDHTVADSYKRKNVPYAASDRGKTILVPWFSDFISPFIPALGHLAGYKFVNLPKSTKESAEAGLKYGHNEVCYPSTLVLGDIITTLKTGKYDLNDTVIAISQTGGQCRATNYISQIKSGLDNAGFSDIPVIVLSTGKVFQNDQQGFKVPVLKLVSIAIYTMLYGDALQQMFSSVTVRQKKTGEAQRLFDHYIERGIEAVRGDDHKMLLSLLVEAVGEFNEVDVYDHEFTRIGLIGEIYVKYNNYGQAHTTEWLRGKGVDVITPPIIDFVMQYFVNSETNLANGVRSGSLLTKWLRPLFWKYMNNRISAVEKIMSGFRYYQQSESIFTKAEYASDILDLSNQFGEGWALAAEVSHYARRGINKIVCVQPFGCIANHIVAKGIEKRIKRFYPDVDMLYLDVDGGMAEVNLQNRLHFLM